jgi:WD40 repeat protein
MLVLTCANAAGSVPLHGDSLRLLRFSPDGRYILAQDNSGIWALTVDPLVVLFRIPVQFAGDAQFTPDSLAITFVSSLAGADRQPVIGRERTLLVRSAPRVERWTIASGTRADSKEIKGLRCETEQLSPDGGTLACDDTEGTLRIVDVGSGNVLFEKKDFVKLVPLYHYNADGSVDLPNGQFLGDLGQTSVDFSPDGRFLLARPTGGEGKALAWDLPERRVVDLAEKLRTIPRRSAPLSRRTAY